MNISEIEKNTQLPDFYYIRDQLKNHIFGRSEQAFLKGDRARDSISDIEQLEKRKKFIRESFLHLSADCRRQMPAECGNHRQNIM